MDKKNGITKKIILEKPIFSDQPHHCDIFIYNDDINKTINYIPHVDIAYLDPPYNQHPYGSNYFMLNTILTNQLDESKIEYEKVIEKAANQIETFLAKIDSESSLQQ